MPNLCDGRKVMDENPLKLVFSVAFYFDRSAVVTWHFSVLITLVIGSLVALILRWWGTSSLLHCLIALGQVGESPCNSV